MADEQQFDFDVALSFAGDSRNYVESVVRGLDPKSVKVFYDDDHKAEMWGEDLVEYLTNVYQHRARYVVIFVSSSYAERMWTNVERQSALARAITQRGAYILPIRLDDTTLSGLLPTVAYLDARVEGVKGIIDIIHEKLKTGRVEVPAEYKGRVPRSSEELQNLVTLRPEFWEYWLYAGTLQLGIEALESKYLDYEMGFAKHTGMSYQGREAFEFLRSVPDNASTLINAFNTVMDRDVQRRAFAEPGVSGDPERIIHMAQRLLDVYEGFMDEAARVLGSSVPASFRRAQLAGAKFGVSPIEEIRGFVPKCVDSMNNFPEMAAGHEGDTPLELHLGMTITIDESVTSEFIDGLMEGIQSLDGD